MQTLGINIGSSSVKVVLLDGQNIAWDNVEPHEGNFVHTLEKILSLKTLPPLIRFWRPVPKEETF